jgi:hypothetical protein
VKFRPHGVEDGVCLGCDAINNTTINNTAFGVNGLGNKTMQIMWVGAKYAVTENLDVIGAYYHYIQDSFFGTATAAGLLPAPAPSTRNARARSMRCPPRSIGGSRRSGTSISD